MVVYTAVRFSAIPTVISLRYHEKSATLRLLIQHIHTLVNMIPVAYRVLLVMYTPINTIQNTAVLTTWIKLSLHIVRFHVEVEPEHPWKNTPIFLQSVKMSFRRDGMVLQLDVVSSVGRLFSWRDGMISFLFPRDIF